MATLATDLHTDVCTVRGDKRLRGSVSIAGFKHALVTVLASAPLCSGRLRIDNVPEIEDTRTLLEGLQRHGAEVQRRGRSLEISTASIGPARLPPELFGRAHGMLYLLPTLLARLGAVEFRSVGGCLIGDAREGGHRPIHHVLDVLRRFGASCQQGDDSITVRTRGFVATTIDLADYCSDAVLLTGPLYSGATKTALLAAAAAKGVTVLKNPYRKADVTSLVDVLKAGGVPIADQGNTLEIQGVGSYGSVDHRLVSDLIEVMTFITCAICTGATLRLQELTTDRVREGLRSELEVLNRIGARLKWADGELMVQSADIRSTNLTVASHGIFSDSHPLFALMLTRATGVSVIRETVWADRFDYARELIKLGARLHLPRGEVIILPKRPSRPGQAVAGRDVRSTAVLLIAALQINGETRVQGLHHLERGYENLVPKLQGLGADIAAA